MTLGWERNFIGWMSGTQHDDQWIHSCDVTWTHVSAYEEFLATRAGLRRDGPVKLGVM